MKIGIKYCGGCNPAYDRKKLIQTLTNKYNDISIESTKDNKVYDLVLIVEGCSRACAEHKSIMCYHKLKINSVKDLKRAEEVIDGMLLGDWRKTY